jgi:predicted Zn-dependent protease with MMP-like domain
VVRVDRETFERLVSEAVAAVPEPFATALDEVVVVVEERAPRQDPYLYGLYVGVPHTVPEGVFGAIPPRIAIYMRPLMDDCPGAAELVEQIRVTVLHELGHHLGMDEEQLERLGYG